MQGITRVHARPHRFRRSRFVCYDGFSEASAHVVCAEMGYETGEVLGPFARSRNYRDVRDGRQ